MGKKTSLIAALFTIAIAGRTFASAADANEQHIYFANVTWGSTRDTVSKQFKIAGFDGPADNRPGVGVPGQSLGSQAVYIGTIDKAPVQIYASFTKEDELVGVYVKFENTRTDPGDVADTLRAKYGDPAYHNPDNTWLGWERGSESVLMTDSISFHLEYSAGGALAKKFADEQKQALTSGSPL